MGKGRLEAFRDGVIAILITIMVLEIRVPHGDDLSAFRPLLPVLSSYVLSFVDIGIYWNNHHHMLHATRLIDGRVLWSNLHLLFWLSLVPIFTAWLGDNLSAPWPAAAYGGVLLMAGVAFTLLKIAIIAVNGPDSLLAEAVGSTSRERCPSSCTSWRCFWPSCARGSRRVFISSWPSMWFAPDPRIEKAVARKGEKGD
jgi:uncharacterized membrane protein